MLLQYSLMAVLERLIKLILLRQSSNDDEYFNLLFTYIISLKEENAKLIEKIENI